MRTRLGPLRLLLPLLAMVPSGSYAFAEDLTYTEDVKPVLDAACVECHHPNGRKPDLSQFPFVGANGSTDQDAIVQRVLARVDPARASMPPGVRTKLTSEQVRILSQWRDQGLQVGPDVATPPGDDEAQLPSLIPPERLARVKAALPNVADPRLSKILNGTQALWYDEHAMTPSYQDSLGASSNSRWPDLVAAPESVIGGLHDRQKHRWQFPFATTAGTDASTNLQVANFVYLPHVGGRPLAIPIWKVRRNYNRIQWMWVYPIGATVGEVIFVVDGDRLLPAEVRTRTRYADGWATNVYRPFPTASRLAVAVKARRPDWESRRSLTRFVTALESPSNLTPKTLAARAALAPTFRQDGWLDLLPDAEDPQLIRELLTETTFTSTYDMPWKSDGAKVAYAAGTLGGLAIVPNNYEAGLLQVTDDACMRCHKETGRLVSEFYDALYLYGEMWGKDGIFSFHPYDESRYPELRSNNENRSINPTLRRLGVFEDFDPRKHTGPHYPRLGPIPPSGG